MSSSAHKSERFLHFDSPAGYDDPIGMLLGCHRRIEKKLATLKALAAHLASKGIDAEASAAAQAVLRYFDTAAIYHHEDEERDLMPLLAKRVTDAGDLARLHALDDRVVQEHREIARMWAWLRKPLEGVADGLHRTLPENDIQALIALYRGHIDAEEMFIVPLARRCLTDEDLKALGRAMATRRGAAPI